MKEYVPVVLWRTKPELLKVISDEFQIAEIIELNLDSPTKHKKLNELYHPHTVL